MKKPMEIFEEFQKIETREEMIAYLHSLPKLDEPWPEDKLNKEMMRG